MRMKTGLYSLLVPAFLTIITTTTACSPAPEASKGADTPSAKAAAERPLPPPWHELKGRTLTVNLPYRASSWNLWGASDQGEGPFTFKSLDNIPGAGPQGTDLAVFIYEADGPGKANLTFGLNEVSQDGLTPPQQMDQGLSKAYYNVDVEVE